MNRKSDLVYPSMRAASAAAGVPYAVLKGAKDAGLPGFERSGRVHLKIVLAALFARREGADALPAGATSWREMLARVQTRRQEIRLQAEREEVISRRFMAAAVQRCHADIDRFRIRSEQEDPLKFAAVAGDVAACREIIRGIWDGICRELRSLGKNFDEPTP